MEHLAAVQARIDAIRSMAGTASPAAGRFPALLADALREPSAAGGGDGAVRTADAAEARAALLGARGLRGPAAPLRAPVQARVSSHFGPRTHPITGRRQEHAGVDFAAPAGTPVRAAGDGTVVFAGARGGYGNLVVVRHPDDSETWYAHQRDLGVRAGDRVAAGDVLGTVGSSGRSTGPHLHFELRRGGTAVDPLPALGFPRR